jgi:hypothetical protein
MIGVLFNQAFLSGRFHNHTDLNSPLKKPKENFNIINKILALIMEAWG